MYVRLCVCMHMYEVGSLRNRRQVLVRFNVYIYRNSILTLPSGI